MPNHFVVKVEYLLRVAMTQSTLHLIEEQFGLACGEVVSRILETEGGLTPQAVKRFMDAGGHLQLTTFADKRAIRRELNRLQIPAHGGKVYPKGDLATYQATITVDYSFPISGQTVALIERILLFVLGEGDDIVRSTGYIPK